MYFSKYFPSFSNSSSLKSILKSSVLMMDFSGILWTAYKSRIKLVWHHTIFIDFTKWRCACMYMFFPWHSYRGPSLIMKNICLFISPSRSPLKSNNLIGSERWPYRVKADTDWNPRRWLWTYEGGVEAVLLGKHEKNILLGNAILLTRISVWFGIVLLWTCYCYMKCQ